MVQYCLSTQATQRDAISKWKEGERRGKEGRGAEKRKEKETHIHKQNLHTHTSNNEVLPFGFGSR
jgi:hypothetical protein